MKELSHCTPTQKKNSQIGVNLADITKGGLRDSGKKKVWQIVFESKPINNEWKGLWLYMKTQAIHLKKPERTAKAKGLPFFCSTRCWAANII